MLVVVAACSLIVYLYAQEYLAGDPHTPRFVASLLLFTLLMLVYVTSDNLLQAFVG